MKTMYGHGFVRALSSVAYSNSIFTDDIKYLYFKELGRKVITSQLFFYEKLKNK